MSVFLASSEIIMNFAMRAMTRRGLQLLTDRRDDVCGTPPDGVTLKEHKLDINK